MAVASAGLYNHTSIPPLSFFTDRMPFLLPNQQRQSTDIKPTTHTHTHLYSLRHAQGPHQHQHYDNSAYHTVPGGSELRRRRIAGK